MKSCDNWIRVMLHLNSFSYSLKILLVLYLGYIHYNVQYVAMIYNFADSEFAD